ncbi:hypothetical protein ACPPVQ_08410 [Diaminobutyricibacter sp. McL0618]|uniref:hypothetical protein n=1 Tax=Leifsonia sp. McL0618 TaxID=3415677 RepID=UPI003CE69959
MTDETLDGGLGWTGTPPRTNQATELVHLADKTFRTVRGTDSKKYAIAKTSPGIALPLRGDGGMREQLGGEYFRIHDQAVPPAALDAALLTIEANAARAEAVDVFIRVGATASGAVVVDLGTPDGRAVIADAAGWRVEANSPVLFRRNAATLSLPEPLHGGTIDGLGTLLNLEARQFRLVAAWMVGALLVDAPQPLLVLTGQQGTAKSSAARLILSTFDPSTGSLRALPRTEEDWAVGAHHSYGIGLDNVSHLVQATSDMICRAITGEAHVRRARYSDDTITVLKFRRPIVMTTINPGMLAGDLADRALLIELRPISRRNRMTETEIDAAAGDAAPVVLGALLDLVVGVLRELPDVHLDEKPRMADFAQMLAALDVATGWQTLADYDAATVEATQSAVDGDSFALAILALVSSGRPPWRGTLAELLESLGPAPHPPDWPRSPRGAADRLQRITPGLAAFGVTIRRGKRANRGREFTIIGLEVGLCEICGQPLAQALIDAGEHTHPTCDPDDGAR